ncbi:hypothetical protein BJY00DRAFT_61194 [Aspergillus carlsbadensis]|nr:hypothetical protein BJY00DRAFT_61194 [Aspergillus carlsbadensis]
MFEKPEFMEWQRFDESRMFWLSGKPGSGKKKKALCNAGGHFGQTGRQCNLLFFCSRNANEPDRQDPKAVLRALIHQLALRSQGGLPKVLRDAFERRHLTGMARDGLDFDESHDLLVRLLNDDAQTTIIMDALDECSEQSRRSLMQSLGKLVDQSSALARVFVSSRGDCDIAARFKDIPNTSIIQGLTGPDIKRSVEQEVRHSIKYKDLLYGEVSPELQGKITTELLAKADGMFLWVRLQMQLLCKMQTEYQVSSLLGRLPPALTETYDRLYEKAHQSPSASEANSALRWLMCAQEPLRPIQWAPAVSWTFIRNPGATQPSRLSAETLLGMCQNLVVYDEMQNKIACVDISVRVSRKQAAIRGIALGDCSCQNVPPFHD